MKITRYLGSLRILAVLACLAGSSAYAVTISITNVTTPTENVSVNGVGPVFIDDLNSPGSLSWTGVGFEVINTPGLANLAIFGSFTCPAKVSCSGVFGVAFAVSSNDPGLNLQLGLSGSYFGGNLGFATADIFTAFNAEYIPGFSTLSLNGTSVNTLESFQLLSTPVSALQTGNFPGQMNLFIDLAPGANVSLPRGSTADLFLIPTANNVPEPTTLGILAGAGALMVYLKRMKK